MLAQYGLFLARVVTLVVAVLATVGGVLILARRFRPTQPPGRLEVKHLNRRYEAMADTLGAVLLPKGERKRLASTRKKERKATAHRGPGPRLFVLDFHGDLRGSAIASLREEITAILTAATTDDQVLLRLDSGGGMLHAYGLAASQLSRLKNAGVRLTVAVDKIAASGGYLMACVADRIVAAPFAVLGSVGVVAQFPNFNRMLRKNDIDFELLTAGPHKRTLTMFGENTEAGREKFQSDLDEAHRLFQAFIRTHRPTLNLDEVATGEHWYGSRARELGLVDELLTSDDFLMRARGTFDILEISYQGKRRLAGWVRALLDSEG